MTKVIFEIIKHPLVVAIIGVLLGVLFTWVSTKNIAPVSIINPDQISVDAAEAIRFDSSSSSDEDGTIIKRQWMVNGTPFSNMTIGTCREDSNGLAAICQFAVPGSHTISLALTDNDGGTATGVSSVKINMPGGYIGLILMRGKNDNNLQRAVNYGVNWGKLQSLLGGKPVILYDPDTKNFAYAAGFSRSIEKASEYASKASDKRVLIGGKLSYEAQDKITIDLAEVGVNATFIPMSFNEVFSAEQTRISSTFVPLSSPEALLKYYE